MRFDKFTIKAQEAVSRAQEAAQKADHAELQPLHLLGGLLSETDGVVLPLLQKLGVADPAHAADRAGRTRPPAQSHRHATGHEPRHYRRSEPGPEGSGPAEGRVRLHRAFTARLGSDQEQRSRSAGRGRRDPQLAALRPQRSARRPARHRPEPRRKIPGPAALRPRPGRDCPAREDRPGHRPGRGDPPHHAGAGPADEEQPRADRRAGRRQDGHRRGARHPHAQRRRPGRAGEQADHRAGHGRC